MMQSQHLAFQFLPVPNAADIDVYGLIAATDRKFNTSFTINCSAASTCQSQILLQPASYNLIVVAKDKTTNTATRSDQLLVVPIPAAQTLTQ